MSDKDQILPEQWTVLLNAASAASAYVASASGGGLEMFKELFSASKFMMDTLKKSSGEYGELVAAFVEKVKGMRPKDARENAVKYEAKDMAGIRAESKRIVADGAAVATALPGGDGFKRWVLDMAREVAATKTGGVLGIGGEAVIDEQEQAALDELGEILDV